MRANSNDQNQTVKLNVHGDKKSNFMVAESIDRRRIYEESNTAQQFQILDSILSRISPRSRKIFLPQLMPRSSINFSRKIYEEVTFEIANRDSPRVTSSELRRISVSKNRFDIL